MLTQIHNPHHGRTKRHPGRGILFQHRGSDGNYRLAGGGRPAGRPQFTRHFRVDLIAAATFQNPQLHSLVHTIHDDRESLFAALRAGAIGYVIKGMPALETLEAVRAVSIGTPTLSPSVARFLIQEFRSNSSSNPDETLSSREVDLLTLSAQGLIYKEIGKNSRSAPAPCTATSSGFTANSKPATGNKRCAAHKRSVI